MKDRHVHEANTAEGPVGDNSPQVQQSSQAQAVSRADAVSSDAPPHASGTGSSDEAAMVGNALQPGSAVLIGNIEGLPPVPDLCGISKPLADFPEPVAYINMKTGQVKSLATLNREKPPGQWWPFNLQKQIWESRAYARAAIAQRQQTATTAWLVEWRFNGVQWLYLWPSAPGGFSFTSDASKALRFARREDAEAALQWARDTDAARRPIGSLTRHGLALGEMLVTEHEWPALTAAPSAQAEPTSLDQEPELLVPCVLPGHQGEWMAENGKRYVLSKQKESLNTRINRRGAQELIDTLLEIVRRNAYEEALADTKNGRWVSADDVDRLVKELDDCINGKGAAPHPKLVDVVCQVRSMNLGIGVPLLEAYLFYKQKQERGEVE